jgi:hypothetical protein
MDVIGLMAQEALRYVPEWFVAPECRQTTPLRGGERAAQTRRPRAVLTTLSSSTCEDATCETACVDARARTADRM